ncbi:hypothetical protein LTR39_006509, partial [Cryomyces antarcticus]
MSTAGKGRTETPNAPPPNNDERNQADKQIIAGLNDAIDNASEGSATKAQKWRSSTAEATTKRIKRNSDHDQPPVASSIEDTHPAPAPDAHALSLALQSPTPGQHVFPASQSPQFHHYVPNTAAQQNSTY